jgi:hypothetical protein
VENDQRRVRRCFRGDISESIEQIPANDSVRVFTRYLDRGMQTFESVPFFGPDERLEPSDRVGIVEIYGLKIDPGSPRNLRQLIRQRHRAVWRALKHDPISPEPLATVVIAVAIRQQAQSGSGAHL